jgi:hypothetical protein
MELYEELLGDLGLGGINPIFKALSPQVRYRSQIAAAHPAAELRGMIRAAAMSIEF